MEEAPGGSATRPLAAPVRFLSLHWAAGFSRVCVSLGVCISQLGLLGADMEKPASGISLMGPEKGNRASIVQGYWEV